MSDQPSVLSVCVHNAGRKGVEAVRPIRDEIKSRVAALLVELLPDKTAQQPTLRHHSHHRGETNECT